MIWIFLVILIIVTAFVVPKLGQALLALVGLATAIGVFFYFSKQAETAASKKRIAPNEIELINLVLVTEYSSEGYTLKGRIKNMSSTYTLNDVTLKITMKDCVEPQQCEIVGEDDVSIWHDVPPGQIRGIEEHVSFSRLPPFQGKSSWNYSISEIKAN